jgi:hypothetical protein
MFHMPMSSPMMTMLGFFSAAFARQVALSSRRALPPSPKLHYFQCSLHVYPPLYLLHLRNLADEMFGGGGTLLYDFGAAGFGLGMSRVHAPPKTKVFPMV